MLVLVTAAPGSASAAANLTLAVTDTPDPATPSDVLTLTVKVRNEGDAVARDASVVLGIPDHAEVDQAPGCINFIGVLTCAIGAAPDPESEREFAPGASATFTLTYDHLEVGEVSIQVNVSHNDLNTDPPPNDLLSKTTIEPPADLKLDLTAVTPVTIGNATTVTATVTNTRDGPARGALLQLVVPTELPVAGMPAGCVFTGLRMTCDLGVVPPQGVVTRAVTLQVPTEGAFILIGSAVWSKPDPTPVDAQGQVTITGLSPVEPVDNGLPVTPAAKPVLPRPQDVAISLITSGVPSGKRCLRTRTLRFKLRRPSGLALKQADLYFGTRRVKRLTGAALRKTVVMTGAPRAGYKLIVVVTRRDGGRLRARRALKTCR